MAELYKPIPSAVIKSHTLEQLEDESAHPLNTPLRSGHLEAFSLASTKGGKTENPGSVNLRIISPLHRRSFELAFGQNTKISWQDEFGNYFSEFSIKGNNLNDPDVSLSETAPSGFLFWGLQESDAMLRILRVSRILRANGIDTEAILKVIEPDSFPVNGEDSSLGDFKKHLINKIWEGNKQEDEKQGGELTRTDIPQLSKALEGMRFFITVRAHLVSERLSDIAIAISEGPEVFMAMMSKIFQSVNIAEKIQATKNSGHKPYSFNVEDSESIQTYFQDYLPKKIGTNLGKLHAVGLVHYHPTGHNISAAGGLYDLDSVGGELTQFEDNGANNQLFNGDLKEALLSRREYPGIDQIIRELRNKGILPPNARDNFIHSLLDAYFKNRGEDFDIMPYLNTIFDASGEFSDVEETPLLSFLLRKTEQTLGWRFNLNKNLDEIAESFAEFHANLARKALLDKSPENPQGYIEDLIDSYTKPVKKLDLVAAHMKETAIEMNMFTAELAAQIGLDENGAPRDIEYDLLEEEFIQYLSDYLVDAIISSCPHFESLNAMYDGTGFSLMQMWCTLYLARVTKDLVQEGGPSYLIGKLKPKLRQIADSYKRQSVTR